MSARLKCARRGKRSQGGPKRARDTGGFFLTHARVRERSGCAARARLIPLRNATLGKRIK
jgi:hypothetical protein